MADRQIGTTTKPASSTTSATRVETSLEAREEAVIDEIRKAIHSVRFGTVQVIVQDGRVVQIDKTEKIRLT